MFKFAVNLFLIKLKMEEIKMAKTKKITFKFFQRSPSNETSKRDNTVQFVEKGGPEKISLDKISLLLSDLKKYGDVPIRSLNKEAEGKYRQFVSYVKLLYGTDQYPKLHDLMKNKFADVTTLVPGTLNAYFVGCVMKSDFGDVSQGCLANCAGSVPPLNASDWSTCKQAVILATKDVDGYKFEVLNSPHSLESAYLYVDPGFTGLTVEEKNKLSSLGVNSLMIVSYTKDTNVYQTLSNWAPLSIIPNRSPLVEPEVAKSSINWSVVVLVIIGVFLLLMFFFNSRRSTAL